MSRGSKPGERRGGRQKGTLNRSTIARQLAVKQALGTYDGRLAKDMLHEAMSSMHLLAMKYHPEAGEEPDEGLFVKYMDLAAKFATGLIGYQAPKLTMVKVAGDSNNPLFREGVTSTEIRERIKESILNGTFVLDQKLLEPPIIEGVANRANNE